MAFPAVISRIEKDDSEEFNAKQKFISYSGGIFIIIGERNNNNKCHFLESLFGLQNSSRGILKASPAAAPSQRKVKNDLDSLAEMNE